MKKKLMMIIISLCVAAGLAAGLVACENNLQNEATNDDDTLAYYGCPNSKRIRKLRLKKVRM